MDFAISPTAANVLTFNHTPLSLVERSFNKDDSVIGAGRSLESLEWLCLISLQPEGHMNKQTLHRSGTRLAGTRPMVSLFFLAVLATPLSSECQELPSAQGTWISNPPCTEWVTLHQGSKTKWATAFLSTMSMGLSRGKREQKFKGGQDFSEAVAAMDAHCAAHPDAQASQAAAAFLNF